MKGSSKFCRGQVWHWTDPIYGCKQDRAVPAGEMTMRFSRYVLIVQTTETIDDLSALCIPLSSQMWNDLELGIEITHWNGKSESHIKPRKVMAVALSQLDDYVCTLSDETMAMIEAELIYYMAPNIWKAAKHMDEDVRRPFDELKEIIKQINEPKPVKEETKPEAKDTEKNLGGRKAKSGTNVRTWDTDKKKEFLKYRSDHSISETADHFSISATSVSRYQKQFSDLVELKETGKTYDRKIPIMKDDINVQSTISGISNYILKDLMNQNVYGYQKQYKTVDDIPDKREFYNKISASLYYSLIDMLGVREIAPGKISVDNISEIVSDDKYKVLDKISTLIKTGISPYQLRSNLKRNEGITSDWMNFLTPQLSKRIQMTPEGISSITSLVRNTYCV